MWRLSRNNQTVVRPTPAVTNTTYVTTRNLISMTTTDINLRAELVCSTERARIPSRNSRNALRSIYEGIQIFVIVCSGYSLATNSLATQS